MTPSECVDEIRSLLECYPDVKVVNAYHHSGAKKTYIRTSITSFQSYGRIVHHCQNGANVPLKTSTAGTPKPKGQPIDISKFRFYTELPDDDGRGSFDNPPSPLQILGIFLVRDLRDLGLITAERASKLLEEWHGGVESSEWSDDLA